MKAIDASIDSVYVEISNVMQGETNKWFNGNLRAKVKIRIPNRRISGDFRVIVRDIHLSSDIDINLENGDEID